MKTAYQMNITLAIKAPFLTSGGADPKNSQLDSVCYRNSRDKIVIPKSHIKGKLREAMKDLADANALPGISIETLFGEELDDGSFKPMRASLVFSDFALDTTTSLTNGGFSTRVSIDRKTGTSKAHFLQMNEQLVKSGAVTAWNGSIVFWAENDSEAKATEAVLKKGFQWITALGSMKGSGYGRLEKVSTDTKPLAISGNSLKPATQYGVTIYFENDLFFGGLVNASNFQESNKIVPGSAIKGAIARSINQLCGSEPDSPIDASNAAVKTSFPTLANYFWRVSFTHAYPTTSDTNERATIPPFSTLYFGNKDDFFDIALIDDPENLDVKPAAQFEIDFKNGDKLEDMFGWAKCQSVNRSRSAIYFKTRTANEEKLYTFKYISPRDENKIEIPWRCNLILPGLETNELSDLVSELEIVFNRGLRFIGKRDTPARFLIDAGSFTPVRKDDSRRIIDGKAIVTLQSDALLFDARSVDPGDDPFTIYAEYWEKATEHSCKLHRFYARQKMYGRYFGKRFNAIADGQYYPFVLTNAGSVFVLEVVDQEIASDYLDEFDSLGLPLPSNIKDKLTQQSFSNETMWQACPFVRENGFGEVAINMEWHWQKKYQ